MRTKTLLLTGALTALGSAALMAQTNVYSVNAVGYINITLGPGYNMIANQLNTTNNTLGSLLNDSTGTYDSFIVDKWTGTTFVDDTGDSTFSGTPTGWDNNGVMTMNPGEAVWIKNPYKTNFNITFIGTVPSGPLTTVIPANAYSMLSSQVPVAGDIITNPAINLTNYNIGDTVFVFNNNPPATPGYTTYSAAGPLFGGFGDQGNWTSTGDPTVAVGQGFWYKNNSSAAINWTRTFSTQ